MYVCLAKCIVLHIFMQIISPKSVASFDLTILHTNDVGARIDSFNEKAQDCTQEDIKDNLCFGGAAKRMTAINKYRAENENALLLDGGDQYQGSLYYAFLKWEPIAEIMNKLGYDAMSFGNHEFDDGVDGLVPFMKEINFPIIATNLKCSESEFGDLFKRYVKLEVGGETIGIVGFITLSSPSITNSPEFCTFVPEVPALQEAVDELKAEGIKKIIAIGHSGYEIDKQICKEVTEIDVVVGGHTNTFLYNGEPPSTEKPVDVYPVVISKQDGHKCLVVQDYAFAKYLGFLQVTFNDDGQVTSWSGNPILMDNRFDPDPETDDIIDKYKPLVEGQKLKPIGQTAAALDGDRKICRARECNLGNLVTDAAVFAFQKKPENTVYDSWTKAAIAIVNGGTVRNSLKLDTWSNVTQGHLYTALPFTSDTFSRYRLKGKYIWDMFEQSVSFLDMPDASGGFLQVSGVNVVYDKSKPVGQRVVSVQMRCAQCPIPYYQPLNMEKDYYIIFNDFLAGGGDGHTAIKDNI